LETWETRLRYEGHGDIEDMGDLGGIGGTGGMGDMGAWRAEARGICGA